MANENLVGNHSNDVRVSQNRRFGRTMICHRMGNDASDKSRSYGTLMSADNIRILDNDKLPSIISFSLLVHLHAPRYRPETGVQLKDSINDKHLGPLISSLWLVIYRVLNDELLAGRSFTF